MFSVNAISRKATYFKGLNPLCLVTLNDPPPRGRSLSYIIYKYLLFRCVVAKIIWVSAAVSAICPVSAVCAICARVRISLRIKFCKDFV